MRNKKLFLVSILSLIFVGCNPVIVNNPQDSEEEENTFDITVDPDWEGTDKFDLDKENE